jgi:signal transduction histidine kinase
VGGSASVPDVPTQRPRTVLEAVARRRFLITDWPWRSLGYLMTTGPPALAAGLSLAVLGVPWFALFVYLAEGSFDQPVGVLVLLVLLGPALTAVFGPLVALPLAELERRRLRLVDSRPVASAHRRPPAAGLWPWVRTRYTEAATWRELGYAGLLATAVPVLYFLVLLLVVLIPVLVASPFLVHVDGSDDAIALGFGQVRTVEQALPYALAGVVLLPAIPYLLAMLAGTHGAVARALLHGQGREELRTRLVEVSRSRARLVDAFEAERRRIERDLHDGAQRRLVGLTLQLSLARLDVPPGSPAAKTLTDAHEQAKQFMTELRELIRGIYPQILTDRGLPAALHELADEAPIPVVVSADLPARLTSHVEATAYFVVAEALTNIAKHSGATDAGVTAHRQGDTLVVEVRDNGRGGAEPREGSGLTGLADRVAVVDGRMLLSSPSGGPTLLRVELPCSQDQPSG